MGEDHKVTLKKFDKNVVYAVIGALILLGIFFVFENTSLPKNCVYFVTIFMIFTVFYIIYLSVIRSKFKGKEMFFSLAIIAIVNKLYIPEVFQENFNISQKTGIIILAIAFIIKLLFPSVRRAFYWIAENTKDTEVIETWQPEKSILKNILKHKVEKRKIDKIFVDSPSYDYNNTLDNSGDNNSLRHKDKSHTGVETILTIVIAILFFAFTFKMMIGIISNHETFSFNNNILNNGNITLLLYILIIVMLSIIISAVIAISFVKVINIIKDVIIGRKNPGTIVTYVVGLIILSLFLSENGYLNQNKLMNFFAEGDIFSFPVACLMIFPVFLIGFQTIIKLFSDSPITSRVRKKAEALAVELLKIGGDILESCIALINLGSADLLSNLTSIIDEGGSEDEENSENME